MEKGLSSAADEGSVDTMSKRVSSTEGRKATHTVWGQTLWEGYTAAHVQFVP